MKYLTLILIAIVILVSFRIAQREVFPKIKGVSLSAPAKQIIADDYDPIINIHANWVAIIPYAFCSLKQPKIAYNESWQWWGERSEGVATSIRYAHDKGLSVMLKPHLWVKDQGWAGDLVYDSEDALTKWKETYRNYILHFSLIAEDEGVEMIAIGTEIRKIASKNSSYFKELIIDVRKIYSGKLTYAANWDNYENIDFWDDLDYIGIDAYFPTSKDKTPSIEGIKISNVEIAKKLNQFSKKHNRKIIFTEYGFESKDYNSAGHWNEHEIVKKANMQAQVNAYHAFFESYNNQNWFAGGFIWKWHYNYSNVGGINNAAFTPQRKPAEKVISDWYNKE